MSTFIKSSVIFLFAIFGSSSALAAIIITKAMVNDDNQAMVKGENTVPNAYITWEGETVTQVSKAGKFNFKSPIVPTDCQGELSDGAETINVTLGNCTPPPPPPSKPPVYYREKADSFEVTCDLGDYVIGGGASCDPQSRNSYLYVSHGGHRTENNPPEPDAWNAFCRSEEGDVEPPTAIYIICWDVVP